MEFKVGLTCSSVLMQSSGIRVDRKAPADADASNVDTAVGIHVMPAKSSSIPSFAAASTKRVIGTCAIFEFW